MNKHNDLSQVRFRMNMDRIKGLVNLSVSDNDAKREMKPFQTIGVKADILRTIKSLVQTFTSVISKPILLNLKLQPLLSAKVLYKDVYDSIT